MSAISLPSGVLESPVRRSLLIGAAGAVGLALGYSLIIGLSSGSWPHLVNQWRTDAAFIALVALGFGIQIGLYQHVRRVVRGDGRAAAMAAGGTVTSTAAMVACCVHHLADVVPFVGLSGLAVFLTDYKIPLVLVSLAANGVGIALMVRTLRHARRLQQAPACH